MVNRTDELNQPLGGAEAFQAQPIPDDPQMIRVQIERTRTQMGQTIEQLQARLSPERIKHETEEAIRDATIGKVQQMKNQAEYEVKSWPTRVTRTIKENPMPSALIGLGIGWLLVSNKDEDAYYVRDNDYGHRYYDDVYNDRNRRYQDSRRVHRSGDELGMVNEGREWIREKTHEARDRVGAATDTVQDKAHETSETAEKRAKEFGHQVQETARETQQYAQDTAEQFETSAREGVRRTKQTFWDMMTEKPLMVGAVALAAGAVFGMSLPATPTENRLMGERRDRMVDDAKGTVQETTRKVQAVARDAQEAAVETAKREVDKQKSQDNQARHNLGNLSEKGFTPQKEVQPTSPLLRG